MGLKNTTGLKEGQATGCCGHGNEILGSLKFRVFLGCLETYRLLKKHSLPWSYLQSSSIMLKLAG